MSFLELDSTDKDELSKGPVLDSGPELKGSDEKDRGYFEATTDPSAEESDESIDSFVKRTEEEYIRVKKKNSQVHGSEEDSSCHTDDKEDSSCTSEDVDKLHKAATGEFKAARLTLKDISSEASLDDGNDTEAIEAVSSDEDYVMGSVGGGGGVVSAGEQTEESMADDGSGDFVLAGEEEDSAMVGKEADGDNGATAAGEELTTKEKGDSLTATVKGDRLSAKEKDDRLTSSGKEDSLGASEKVMIEMEKKESRLMEVDEVAGYEMVSTEHDPLAFDERERDGLLADKGGRGEEVITGKNVTLGESGRSGSLLRSFRHEARKRSEDVKPVEIRNNQGTVADKIEEDDIKNAFGFDDSDGLESNINVPINANSFEDEDERSKDPLDISDQKGSSDKKPSEGGKTSSGSKGFKDTSDIPKIGVSNASPQKKPKVDSPDSSGKPTGAFPGSTPSKKPDSSPPKVGIPGSSPPQKPMVLIPDSSPLKKPMVASPDTSPSKKPKIDLPDSSPSKTTGDGAEKKPDPLDIMKDNTIKVRILKVPNKQGTPSNIFVYSGKESAVSATEKTDVKPEGRKGNIVIGKQFGGIQLGIKSENKDVPELKVIGGIIKRVEKMPDGAVVLKQAAVQKKTGSESGDSNKNKTQPDGSVAKIKVTSGMEAKKMCGTITLKTVGGAKILQTRLPSGSGQAAAWTTPTAQKKCINIEKVKRKLEEILETSKAEEDAAVVELQRMKKEKKEILDKITAEMDNLKGVISRGKTEGKE